VRAPLALLLAGALIAPAAAAAASPAPSTPALTWGPCTDGAPAPLQCATAAVPLDYRNPSGPTISLALVRHPAEDPAARIGSLFMNPGGPGGSGVDLVEAIGGGLPDALRARFDIVGFDPRGVARSSPIVCWTRREYDAAFRATKVQRGPDLSGALRRARSFTRACVRRSRALLPFIGTGYVARDMDLLRAAVGDDKLTYVGFSFGTYIGTVYANLFPARVRALTLDGSYDPVAYARRPYDYDRGQYVALEGSLSRFFAWCSRHARSCGFGKGRAAPAFDRLMARLEAHPRRVRTPDGVGTLDAAEALYQVALTLDGGRISWPSLGESLARTQRGARGSLPPVSAQDAALYDANTAVECADRAFPRSRRVLRRRLAQNARLGRRLGRVFAYGPPAYDQSHATACVQWPASASDHAPSRYRGSFGSRGAARILVVGTTGDPDTPYRDAVTLSRTLTGASLLTLRGEGHTAFLRSACINAQVVGYLVDLTAPRVTTCADELQPSG
jgi:pimeloyl-ACP methyl ester carboxylesterase